MAVLVRARKMEDHSMGKSLVASLCVLLLLFLSVLAVDSSLHGWFHKNANAPDHQCAVTALAKGHVHHASVGPALFFAAAEVSFLVFLPEVHPILRSSFILPPSCG